MEDQLSKRFIAAFAGALAIAVLAAGCGGGGGSDTSADTTGGAEEQSSSVPALTKAEFIAKGDAICTKTEEKTTEDVAAFVTENGLDEGEAPSQEQEEELVTTVVLPLIQEEAEELGELGSPKGEEGKVEEIVEGAEEVVAEGEGDPSSVIGSDDPFADVNAKAQDFGFKVCGEP
jgi:hypothetical protein